MKLPFPAATLSSQEIDKQRELIAQTAEARIFRDFPKAMVILNALRQMVYINQEAQRLLDAPDEVLLGKRVGEALRCVHAEDEHQICGTMPFCLFCGAAQGMHQTLEEGEGRSEIRITRYRQHHQEPLDLQCWGRLLHREEEKFILFMVEDISHVKREAVLERFFYHDLINSISSLKSIITLLEMEEPAIESEFLPMAHTTISELVEQIQAHRDLKAAERENLVLHTQWITVQELTEPVYTSYRINKLARNKTVKWEPPKAEIKVQTDPVLLKRILGNMVKNALEASREGEEIIISSQETKINGRGIIRFTVTNSTVMPPEIKSQVFNRSFSTKGDGRGTGTYSMKLLGERYLEGTVWFTSEEGKGTTFGIDLPLLNGDLDGT